MPFSSLSDPADLARACAALDAVWNEVKDTIPDDQHEKERSKIAYLVAAFVTVALDQEDLTENVLLRYRQSASVEAVSAYGDRLGRPGTTVRLIQ